MIKAATQVMFSLELFLHLFAHSLFSNQIFSSFCLPCEKRNMQETSFCICPIIIAKRLTETNIK